MTDLVPQEAWDAIGSRTYRGFYRSDSIHEMITNAVRDAAPFIRAAALEESATSVNCGSDYELLMCMAAELRRTTKECDADLAAWAASPGGFPTTSKEKK